MNHAPSYLQNYQLLVDAFDTWPSFHDAEIMECKYDSASVELAICVFEMTPQTDEKGFFKLAKHHIVTMKFDDIFDAKLGAFNISDWFGAVNVLQDMEFSTPEAFQSNRYFTVQMQSVVSPEYNGIFNARAGNIVSVTPYEPEK